MLLHLGLHNIYGRLLHIGLLQRSLWATFKAGPEFSGRTKPKWSVPLDEPTEISAILCRQSLIETRRKAHNKPFNTLSGFVHAAERLRLFIGWGKH